MNYRTAEQCGILFEYTPAPILRDGTGRSASPIKGCAIRARASRAIFCVLFPIPVLPLCLRQNWCGVIVSLAAIHPACKAGGYSCGRNNKD